MANQFLILISSSGYVAAAGLLHCYIAVKCNSIGTTTRSSLGNANHNTNDDNGMGK